MLFSQPDASFVDFEAKKFGSGESKTRFMNVQGDVVLQTDDKEFLEGLKKVLEVVLISQPVVDV